MKSLKFTIDSLIYVTGFNNGLVEIKSNVWGIKIMD